MTRWNDEDGLRWRALSPFGVEIDHDLAAPFSEAAADRFIALFRQAGLIIAHGQALSLAEQTALMTRVGPVLNRTGESGYITTEHEHSSARAEYTFHADAGYTAFPLEALSLHAVDVVDGASSTRFAGADRGFATLPAALGERLTAHAAEMISPGHEMLATRVSEIREPSATWREERPTVLVNPRTGRRCIGVSEMHAARLIGMDWEESRALLGEVYDHLYARENTMEHVWHKGDLVIWDNLTFQHARGPLASVGRRVLQRVVVGVEGRRL